MKTLNTALFALVSLVSFSASADQTFKSEVDYVNPNGCRVFDMVVQPDCDPTITPKRCADVETVVNTIGQQIPNFQVTGGCDRLHTGNFFKRMLDEFMMNSSSFDGYKLQLKATDSGHAANAQANAVASDASVCADGVAAFETLAGQGLKVSAVCDANELRIQINE